jgi:hypothetical protein
VGRSQYLKDAVDVNSLFRDIILTDTLRPDARIRTFEIVDEALRISHVVLVDDDLGFRCVKPLLSWNAKLSSREDGELGDRWIEKSLVQHRRADFACGSCENDMHFNLSSARNYDGMSVRRFQAVTMTVPLRLN